MNVGTLVSCPSVDFNAGFTSRSESSALSEYVFGDMWKKGKGFALKNRSSRVAAGGKG